MKVFYKVNVLVNEDDNTFSLSIGLYEDGELAKTTTVSYDLDTYDADTVLSDIAADLV